MNVIENSKIQKSTFLSTVTDKSWRNPQKDIGKPSRNRLEKHIDTKNNQMLKSKQVQVTVRIGGTRRKYWEKKMPES